jgi:hypothetical protein
MWQGQVARISIQIDYIDDLDLQVGSPEKVDFFQSWWMQHPALFFLKKICPILNPALFLDAHVEKSGISHGISQLAMQLKGAL